MLVRAEREQRAHHREDDLQNGRVTSVWRRAGGLAPEVVRYEWFFYVFEASLMLCNACLWNLWHIPPAEVPAEEYQGVPRARRDHGGGGAGV